MYQPRSEISSIAALPSLSVRLGGGIGCHWALFCLLLRDFVEMVITYRRDFAVITEECIVDRHHGTFLWIDYNIIDSVFSQQGRSIRCAGINLLNFSFTRAGIDPMRPDMTGVPHH